MRCGDWGMLTACHPPIPRWSLVLGAALLGSAGFVSSRVHKRVSLLIGWFPQGWVLAAIIVYTAVVHPVFKLQRTRVWDVRLARWLVRWLARWYVRVLSLDFPSGIANGLLGVAR